MRGRRRHLLVFAWLALAGVTLAGCGSTSNDAMRASLRALQTPTPSTASTKKPEPKVKCADATASLRPIGALQSHGRMPAGSFMSAIQRRGYLIAGVDQNTLLFAYVNPFTGRFQGFEIDLLRQIAKSIFGDPNRVVFKAVTTAQRLPYVQRGRVDIVADAVTMNCYRWREVSFSTVYYDAGQRLLVPKNSRVRGLGDLAGKRVCVTEGGTAFKYLAAYRTAHPRHHPIASPRPQSTDCLVALQQGRVAAIASDDAILLGFARQDPYTKIVGPRFTDEPYGMAISRSHPDLVRFVNAVLARMRSDGAWSALYRKWLGSVAGPQVLPKARYRD